jgi:RNA polymerase sigma-70 factor (ECF subfamily)
MDLTQGFFHEIVLERQLFCQAEQHKGRFRSFLLTTLNHYLNEQHRKSRAQKRCPKEGMVSLDTHLFQRSQSDIPTKHPDQAFMYAWAASLVTRVLTTLQIEYEDDGRAAYWDVFCDRVLHPILNGDKASSLEELCKKHRIETERKASNMITTVKRRFRVVLRNILAETVDSDGSIDGELTDLIQILSQGQAV